MNTTDKVREALENLKNHQRQLDMEGCMVGVSRQALEEVLSYLSAQDSGMVLVPSALTAENGAKAALIGEFYITREAYDPIEEEYYAHKIPIDWPTIKDIYAAAIKHFTSAMIACSAPDDGGGE